MIAEAEVARLAAGLPPQALLVLDGAYAEFVGGFDGHAGLVEARDNVVMTRTFSKIHGLGGLRVGWGYGPAHVIDVLNRVRGPFNLSTPALAAAEAAVRDTAWTARCFEENRAQPRPAARPTSPRSGCRPTPSHANFVLARFRDRAEAEACDRALREAGIIVRKVAGYKLPAALRITVGDAEACAPGRRGGRALHAGAGVIALPPRRADRARADRLVDQPRDPPHRGAGADHRPRPHGRRPAPRRRGSGSPRCSTAPATRSRAPTSSILCVPVGAMAEVAAEIAPRLAPGATVSDVGSVKRAVIEAVAPHLPAGVALRARRIRWPAPSTRGRAAGFAALFDNRWCLLTPLPDDRPGGGRGARRLLDRRSARGSTRWTPTTTTWCWR